MINNKTLCYEIGGSFESYKVLKYPSLHLIFKIKYIFVRWGGKWKGGLVWEGGDMGVPMADFC